MRLILGEINDDYLRNITLNAEEASEVRAAVAYAHEASLLFDWCANRNIPLRYYGRLDEEVAVSVPILENFLAKASPGFSCKLVQHHHAKVIWWCDVGVYIGSANLTNQAWYKNIEAGCFFPEFEIDDDFRQDLLALFQKLEENATPLTKELVDLMKSRSRAINARGDDVSAFWSHPSLNRWDGLSQSVARRAVSERRRAAFLKEWKETLQQIRDIGVRISLPKNRPIWLKGDAPVGAQADQFLHAFYYHHAFEGRRSIYETLFEKNRKNPVRALDAAVDWWRGLKIAPSNEDTMLNETAPFLRTALSQESLAALDYDRFRAICGEVHAFKEYSRRAANKSVALPSDRTQYQIPEKIDALSRRIWGDQSSGGHKVTQLLQHILYGGAEDLLPERLWQAVVDPKWKIAGLGISSLGELCGWAMPDRFPPRNGRTSKALRALGYDVRVHSG